MAASTFPLEGRTIDLDTRFSVCPATPYHTYWNVARDNFISISGYMISVRSVEFSNAVYNINEYYDTVYIQENGGPVQAVTLEHLHYTADDLAIELQAALNAAPGLALTYTVIFDEMAQKFTISVLLPDIINFVDGDSSMYGILGFDTAFSSGSALTSDYQCRLGGTQHVYLLSNIVKDNLAVNCLQRLLATVPVTAPAGETNYWQSSTVKEFFVPAGGVEQIQISVYDDNKNPWKLDPNHFMRIELFFRPIQENPNDNVLLPPSHMFE